jgi:predicted dehydrogenase
VASPSKGTYRVGLIGCGRAGAPRGHVFDKHPQCELTAIADTDAENLELGCENFGVPGYSTYEEMFANQELDIALPILPVRPNADAVVAAARAGVRAIFCEKPLTARLEDADRMVEECRSRGVHLAAGVVVSSHVDYQKAYALAASGEIGEVRRINLYETNGQGGCHGLNLARKFADKSQVEFVTGWVEGDPFSDHEEPYDEAETGFGGIGGYIRFANGIECYSSYNEVDWRGIEVVGTEGVIYNWNNTTTGLRLRKKGGGERSLGHHDLREAEGLFGDFSVSNRDYDETGWRSSGGVSPSIVQAIVDSLDTGAQLTVTTGDDLRHALEIAIAMRESARRGSAAVKLPLEDRSLVMYPERSRWHYKKDVHGREWYMEQMANVKRPALGSGG